MTEDVGFSVYQKVRFADWFDYDNDGDMDYIIQGDGPYNELWKNEGGTFVDATQDVALDLFSKCCQACLNTGDMDNDGDQDVFIQINDWTGDEIEALLLNDVDESGQIAFVDVAFYAGLTKLGDRKGSAILDYDMDGLLDIFVPSSDWGGIMYHNLGTESPRNWIGFDLWGTQSSRDPLGTLVSLYTGGKKQIRYTKAATTWKVQDNPFVHFGIGQAPSIDSVVIRWPMGTVQVLTDLVINQYHIIEESNTTQVATQKVLVPEKTTLQQNFPNPFNSYTNITFSLSKSQFINLTVFNINGKLEKILVDDWIEKGLHEFKFYPDNLPSGIYYYILASNSSILEKKKLILLK